MLQLDLRLANLKNIPMNIGKTVWASYSNKRESNSLIELGDLAKADLSDRAESKHLADKSGNDWQRLETTSPCIHLSFQPAANMIMVEESQLKSCHPSHTLVAVGHISELSFSL